MLCKFKPKLNDSSDALFIMSAISNILEIIISSYQRLSLDGFVVLKIMPEEVQPVSILGFAGSETRAIIKVHHVLVDSTVEWTLPAFRNEMSVSIAIHPFVGCHC